MYEEGIICYIGIKLDIIVMKGKIAENVTHTVFGVLV